MTTLTVYVYDNSGYFLYPLDAYSNPTLTTTNDVDLKKLKWFTKACLQ